MAIQEIPEGTRAVLFMFACERSTEYVRFDLTDVENVGKTYHELRSLALRGVLRTVNECGHVLYFLPHFISMSGEVASLPAQPINVAS
jgi:hypothetical protein